MGRELYGAVSYNSIVSNPCISKPHRMIQRLINAGARVSHHVKRWDVHMALDFPLACHNERFSAMGDAGLQWI